MEKEWNENLPKVKIPKRKKAKRKKKAKPKRKESRIKRKFEETDIGSWLKLKAPLEYMVIVAAGGNEPLAELIESVGYASDNPYFRTVCFRRALIKYRKNGGCYQSSVARGKKEKKSHPDRMMIEKMNIDL